MNTSKRGLYAGKDLVLSHITNGYEMPDFETYIMYNCHSIPFTYLLRRNKRAYEDPRILKRPQNLASERSSSNTMHYITEWEAYSVEGRLIVESGTIRPRQLRGNKRMEEDLKR